MNDSHRLLLDRVGKSVYEALLQVCSGGISYSHNNTNSNIQEEEEVASFQQPQSKSKLSLGENISPKKEGNNRSTPHGGVVSTKKKKNDAWCQELKDLAYSSVSFPNNPNNPTSSIDGKPHDIEVRAALALFHKYNKHKSQSNTKKKQKKKKKKNPKRKRMPDDPSSSSMPNNDGGDGEAMGVISNNFADHGHSPPQQCPQQQQPQVLLQVTSDLGLTRTISSPLELAELLSRTIEESCRRPQPQQQPQIHQDDREEKPPSSCIISHDIRSNASGIICIITPPRAATLRQFGRLPCPQCVKWCKGEKGLWWHQQQEHGSEHSVAAASAAKERETLAIVPYNNPTTITFPTKNNIDTTGPTMEVVKNDTAQHLSGDTTVHQQQHYYKNDEHRVLEEIIKTGNLQDLVKLVVLKKHTTTATTNITTKKWYDPTSKRSLDRNGASPLHWASGLGYLDIVQYLISPCGCSPEEGQQGKRSFAGRTPLHWASRNGHLNVVTYLVNICKVNIDATTADGTTAFCWACWQGHLPVMKFLHESGCNVHQSNSFGCNAILWCAQGGGDIETMKWLQSIGCETTLVNSNGHGALHKAAQRGRLDVCQWFCSSDAFKDAACRRGVVSSYAKKKHSDTLRTGRSTTTTNSTTNEPLQLIAPDSDGCCPSDLAGMAGHEELALWIARQEVSVSQEFYNHALLQETKKNDYQLLHDLDNGESKGRFPNWISHDEMISNRNFVGRDDLNVWEPQGGIRRVRSGLQRLLHDQDTHLVEPGNLVHR